MNNLAGKFHLMVMNGLKTLGTWLSRTEQQGKLAILIYHRVHPKPYNRIGLEVDAQLFDQQMGLMAKYFNVLPLADAVQSLKNNSLPPRAVCITFDDGYADNCEVALPILKKWQLPATFFIASGFLNGGCMWNDKILEAVFQSPLNTLMLSEIDEHPLVIDTKENKERTANYLLSKLIYLPHAERAEKVEYVLQQAQVTAPNNLMMTVEQLCHMKQQGMDIGGHTCSHPILASLPETEAEQEIANNKAYLESVLGEPLRVFAYPNGKPGRDYQAAHINIVKKLGYECAVSTAWGVSSPDADCYQLARFTPWDTSSGKFMLRHVLNYRNTLPEVV